MVETNSYMFVLMIVRRFEFKKLEGKNKNQKRNLKDQVSSKTNFNPISKDSLLYISFDVCGCHSGFFNFYLHD